MDTHHNLLPQDAHLLDAVGKRTAARLADVLDGALGWLPQPRAATRHAIVGHRFIAKSEDFRDFMATKDAWAVRAFACCCVGTREKAPKEILETEVEWVREDVLLGEASRERALDDLIELVQGLDAMLVFQAGADIECFSSARTHPLAAWERESLEAGLVNAYRRRHIAAGFHRLQFLLLLSALLSKAQRDRLERELAHIVRPTWRFH